MVKERKETEWMFTQPGVVKRDWLEADGRDEANQEMF